MDERAVADLFEAPVSVCIADPDMYFAPLFPEEEIYVRKALPVRHREFSAGRSCARTALAMLGADVGPIITEADRCPRWPESFSGSITHCKGFCAAVVARAADAAGLGFDAEGAELLATDLYHLVCRPNDLEHFGSLPKLEGVDWPKLAFSAKEAFYKCYYPITRTFMSFCDASVIFFLDHGREKSGTFEITIENISKPLYRRAPDFIGRWVVDGGRIYTGVTLSCC